MKSDKQIEEMIIDTLESSGPGKLGMIPLKLLEDSVHHIARDLEKRKIVEIIISPVYKEELGEDVTVIRMAGRRYPKTIAEADMARNNPEAWERLKRK